MSSISLSIVSLMVIMLAANNGVLETNFAQSALMLFGILIAGFVLPFVTQGVAAKKIKENK